MAPQFTSGTVRIADERLGSGDLTLVVIPGWVRHLEYDWATPEIRSYYERLACRTSATRSRSPRQLMSFSPPRPGQPGPDWPPLPGVLASKRFCVSSLKVTRIATSRDISPFASRPSPVTWQISTPSSVSPPGQEPRPTRFDTVSSKRVRQQTFPPSWIGDNVPMCCAGTAERTARFANDSPEGPEQELAAEIPHWNSD